MRKMLMLLLCTIIVGVQLMAQSRVITGKVTDANGTPISNASVLVRGTKIGTTTSENGTYSLTVPQNAKAILISAIGLVDEEISIGTKTVINSSLKNEDKNLQEVVVVGYGTQKKKTVTSAMTRVDGKIIADLPTTSFDRQLAGRAAGVQVIATSGLVSAPPRIRIRGVNSISQNRDPLFVIDGIPTFNGGGSGLVNTNVLADINPLDIEAIDVLKDGAATAIYGSRAANGVVLITTKKGRNGKLTMNYDMNIGSSQAFNKPKLLNATDFVTIANEKLTNANLTADARLNAENTNTNWLNEIFNKSATFQSHTLSVSGGSDKTTFYMSLNYLEQDGIIRTNVNKRYNIRANMEHKINKYVKVGNNITLSRTEDNDQNNGGNALSGAMAAAQRALPNVRVLNPNHPTGYNLTPASDALGSDSNKRNIENNYVNIAYVLNKNIYRNDRTRIINNFFVEIAPIKQVYIRTQASVDYINSNDFQSLDKVHGDGRSAQGSLYNQNYQFTIYTIQNYANWTQSFGNHNLTLVAGMETQRTISRNFFGQGTTISDPFFQSDNLISNTFVNQFSGGGFSKAGFQSYFGRANYDYANKYFIQASFRRDGISSLAPEYRFGNFFGASAGWRISEEKFWTNLNLNKVINELKFRGSYAEVGNPLTGFPYLSTYGPAPYGAVAGNAANRVGNRSLRWETNKKTNIGLDATFLRNRLNFSVDYFENKNDGQVLDEPQPVSFGIPGNIISKNIGVMENKGIEFSLGGEVLRKGEFSWNINMNYTHATNKVKALAKGQTEVPVAGPNTGTFNILRVGQGINAFFGYNSAGVNSANGNPMWYKEDGSLVQYNNVPGAGAGYFGVVKPGDPTLGAATTLGNRYIIGNSLPTYFGGISNTFSYRGFSLEVFLRFGGGNKVYNLTRQEVWNSQGFVNNGTEVLNRWTPTNTITDVPKLYYGRDNQVNLQGQANSRFLEKGDFVRLQNMLFAYQFNPQKVQRATNNFLKSVRWFVQAQNLFVWSKYTGIDPENFTELGIDNSSVPQLRTFTTGINIGF